MIYESHYRFTYHIIADAVDGVDGETKMLSIYTHINIQQRVYF